MKIIRKNIYFIISAMILAVGLIVGITSRKGYSEPLSNNAKVIVELAKDSDLILIGNISDISIKKAILGTVGKSINSTPYYTDFEYITIAPEKIIKGQPKIFPIVMRQIAGTLSTIGFEKEEKVLLFLKWSESDFHGRYYHLQAESKRKFLVDKDGKIFNKFLGISMTVSELETILENL